MAKARKSRVSNFNRDLPTPEETTKIVSNVTNKKKTTTPTGKTFSIDDMKKPPRQKAGVTRKGRVKFTTMLHPDLKIKLQNVANNNAISVADVLETIVNEYFGLNK